MKIPKKLTKKQRREFNHRMEPRKEIDWKGWEDVLKNFKPKGGE